MSARRIVFPEDTSDDELSEGDGSEQMESNNRCDDGDKNAKERVCTHCDFAFKDATALEEHLYEMIAETMKKNNIYSKISASIGKTRSKPSANVLTDGHKDNNSNRRSTVSEEKLSQDSGSSDSYSRDSDNENLDSKDEKMPRKCNISVRNSNIMVMYECLICHTRLRSQHYVKKHRRVKHPGLPSSRVFKTVYMKIKECKRHKVKDTKSKTFSINKIHIENINLSDLPEAVKIRPKCKVQNTKDTTKKVIKTNQKPKLEKPKKDNPSGNSKGLQRTNMERKRKSEDRDTSSGKVRRITQDGEESCAQVLYRCNLCEVHFVSEKMASTHLEFCRNGVTIEPVNCGKCGRLFQPKELGTHSVRDHRHSEVNFKIVNISPVLERQTPKGTPSEKKQEKAPKQDKVPLFKCQECDAHFVTPYGLRTHKQRDPHDMELIKCKICDYSFTTRSHNAHIIEYHDRLGLQRQDFEVVANNVSDPLSSRRTRNTASENDFYDETDTDVTEKDTSESDRDWSPKKKVMTTLQKRKTNAYTKKISTVLSVARASTTKYGPSKKVLYKCGKKRCGLFFTTFCGVKEHVSKELHEADLKLKCKFCKNYFSKKSLIYHLKFHHTKKQDVVDDNVAILPLDINSLKGKVYKCSTCNVHFVQQHTLETHMKNGSHKIAKKPNCRKCGLTFTTHSLTKHIKVHHDEMKLSREDVIVEEYDEIKRACPVKTNVRRDSAKHDQKIAQTDADKINPIVAEPEAIPLTSSQNSTAVPTLFKCVPCDVHFTEQTLCLSHIVEHKPFDRLQFLKCPECELQYENNCLLRHRVVHRGEFVLEKVLVKAYMPCENSFDIPTVETHYAARKTATAITACKNLSTILQTEPAI